MADDEKKPKDGEGEKAEKGHGKLHEKKAPEKMPIPKPSFAWEGPPALVVVGGAGLTIGSRLNLKTGTTVLGRSPDVDLPVLDGSVSRRHAEITIGENGVTLVHDLESRHGTFVNDARIAQPTPLVDGDYLRCGNVVLKFRTAKEGAKPAEKPAKAGKAETPAKKPEPKPAQLAETDTGPAAAAAPSPAKPLAPAPAASPASAATGKPAAKPVAPTAKPAQQPTVPARGPARAPAARPPSAPATDAATNVLPRKR